MGPTLTTHASPSTVQPGSSSAPHAAARPAQGSATKIVVPVRYSAWLSGDLGRSLERTLHHALARRVVATVTRLPKALLIESHESPGPLLEAAQHAAKELEASVEAAYPVLHHQMGPVWTGTLQAVFA